jgi:hypothetical protein
MGVGYFSGYKVESSGFIYFFLFISMSKLFNKALKDGLEVPSFKLLYQSIKQEIRFDVQAKIDGTINEIAALTSGILLSILGALTFIQLIDFSLVLFIILGIWFFAVDQYDYSLALLTLSASLLAFMIYNYSPAKIFMGDTGTMTIGLIMALSLIKFDEINSIISSHYSFVNAPGIAFSFVSLLLFDLLRVSFSRIFKRKSPFHADNTHIHHLFVRMGMNHNIISLVIVSFVITQIALSIILDSYFYSSFNIILINIAYLLLFYSIIFMFLRKNKYKKR